MTQISFVGNTTDAAQLRYTQSGKAVANVTVAVNRKKGDTEETDFHRVAVWGEFAEHVASLDKGTRVVVIGRLKQREYETKEGEKRQAWEVDADSFGPDLRFATVQVTRSQGTGASSAGFPAGSGTNISPNVSGVSGADSWNTSSTELPF